MFILTGDASSAIACATECFSEFIYLSISVAYLQPINYPRYVIQSYCERFHRILSLKLFVYIYGRLGFTEPALFCGVFVFMYIIIQIFPVKTNCSSVFIGQKRLRDIYLDATHKLFRSLVYCKIGTPCLLFVGKVPLARRNGYIILTLIFQLC